MNFSKLNKIILVVVILLYSYFNLKILSFFLANDGAILIGTVINSSGNAILGLTVGLFLNAALIVYVLNKTKLL